MIVSCWLTECIWNNDGLCNRGTITIDELKECEDFEDYSDSYNDSFWKVIVKHGVICRKLAKNGKKIEYNGYVFYTEEKITAAEYYHITEERTGVGVGTFGSLKSTDKWKQFVEKIGTYPDVSTYPVEEEKGDSE